MQEGGRGLVLVIEDERPIADLVRMYLSRDGFGVHVETTGDGGLAAARRLRPVACIVDIGLPAMDGTEVCRRLREQGDWTPVIFLTARDDEVDRVVGLELGADDYVTKPFSPRELVARVKAVLRRGSGLPDAAQAPRRVGVVTLDPGRRRVQVDGSGVEGGPGQGVAEVALTSTEFDLLAHLMSRPGRVFTREELLASVWGYAAHGGTRTVDVHVAQVRAKLEAASPLARDVIRTVRGVGYTADDAGPGEWSADGP
ncbi:MAG TPA: response regulator transcription factor [Micromonosporaceae bacterium]|jgi:DNA-binding response OmpR family regulator